MIARIVALFLLIIAIRRAQRFRFFAPYFKKKKKGVSTKVQLFSLYGKFVNRGDGEKFSHGKEEAKV